jgi:hypothetical protein
VNAPFDEASFGATSAILAKNMRSVRENTCTSSKGVVLKDCTLVEARQI